MTNAPLNFCTIIAKNYLPHARVLSLSIRKHHPEASIYVLLADRLENYFDPEQEPFELFYLEDLSIPQLPRFCFQYQLLELNTAAKPYFLKFLFDRFQMQKLVYLDPDIQVFSPMTELDQLLDKVGIVLTPHILTPYATEGWPSEIDILLAGTYNLGFIGLSNKESSKQLLRWWQEKLYKGCLHKVTHGYMVDQKWIDLVPSYFEDVEIFRNEAYNVAYWNLHERALSYSDGRLMINGKPCVFYHFSGFNPLFPSKISKFQNRLSMDEIRDGKFVYENYTRELVHQGYEKCRRWPYSFDYFDNGYPISAVTREFYRNLNEQVLEYGDPFKTIHDSSFFNFFKKNKALLRMDQGVNLIGMFKSEKGTGQAARCVLRSLKEIGVMRAVLNYDAPPWAKNSESIDEPFSKTCHFDVNLININADIPLVPVISNEFNSLSRCYNIGYWNWELETFPNFWLDRFTHYNEIWVPSTFTQFSIQSKSPIPVICMPYSISVPKNPNPFPREKYGLKAKALTFLNVFDCDSTVARKNPQAVIKAFRMAFKDRADVQLVIKTMSISDNADVMEELKKLAEGAKNIVFINGVFLREESHSLMHTCDVFVSLHRSEGFGFNICEAMAMGKPVIATNYSANTDYMKESNGYLVDYQKIAIDRNYGPYKKGELWADPDIRHAALLMKHIDENPNAAKRKGEEAAKTMETHYNDQAIGKKMSERIDYIYNFLRANEEPIWKKIRSGFANNSELEEMNLIKNSDAIINHPIVSHRPVIGNLLILTRKMGRWLVKPLLERQNEINNSQLHALKSLNDLVSSINKEVNDLK